MCFENKKSFVLWRPTSDQSVEMKRVRYGSFKDWQEHNKKIDGLLIMKKSQEKETFPTFIVNKGSLKNSRGER